MSALWIDDPKVLLSIDPEDWNPICGPVEKKINALTRLIVVVAAVFSVKNKNTKIFQRCVMAVSVAMIVYTLFDTPNVSNFGQAAVTPAPKSEDNPVTNTHNPLGNWLPPITSTATPAIANNTPGAPDTVLTNGVPTDDAFGNRSLTRPFYKTPEDNDNFKNFLYADGLENTFKQGAVYSHLSCPYSMGVAPGNSSV